MMHVKMQGFYRLLLRDGETGELKKDTGWFENLITNQGLDWFGGGVPTFGNVSAGKYMNGRVGVGTGNTAPSFSDTALAAPLAMYPTVAMGGTVSGGTTTYVVGPPAYWRKLWTYSYPVGAVVGNIAEVGVGGISVNTETTPQLFSRALIVDGGGVPTTISVTAADALTVIYELRQYFDVTDNPYSVDINGITYSGIYRRANINTPNTPSSAFGAQIDYDSSGPNFATNAIVYNGTIGAVTGNPSGAFAGGGNDFTLASGAYVPGTYYKSFTIGAAIGKGNLSGGITAVVFFSGLGAWQFGVSPAIPKDATKTMQLDFTISWARYP